MRRVLLSIVVSEMLAGGITASGHQVTGLAHSGDGQLSSIAFYQREPGGGAPAPARAGLIVGRVVTAGSGTPVRGAEVTADFGTEAAAVMIEAARRTAVTDDDGRFELRDLRPGPWVVTVSKTGYVTWRFGQRRPFEKPQALPVESGQRVTADINLPRGGAIAGRVYDELAEPASNVRVNVYRARMDNGGRRLQTIGAPDHTDDTGAFRIHGLPPGDYYVAASLRIAPADSVVDTTYSPTYFPGTGNIAEAQRVRLELGGEALADFQLLPVRRVRIEGAVQSASGGAASAFLNLMSDAAELGVPLGVGGATRADGTFTLPDVMPGSYTLYTTLRDSEPEEAAEIRLSVGSDDITGITLVTGRPATIRGTFTVDPPTRPVPQGLGINARSSRTGGPMTVGQVSRGAFDVAAPTGPFRLDVHDLPDGWTVKSVMIDGVDATDDPVELRSGQTATARVVLTDRVTDVRGAARTSGGAAGAAVIVFPEEPARWLAPSRHVRSAAVDAQGRFRIRGLPPGERYLALAVDYLEEGEGSDPEFLARMAGRATPFALPDGELMTIDLQVIER